MQLSTSLIKDSYIRARLMKTRSAGLTAARTLTAITPTDTGITAERAALEVSITNFFEFSSFNTFIHFLFLLVRLID